MSLPKNKHQRDLQDNRFLKRIIVALFVMLVFIGIGLWRIPTLIKIHQAPDVTKAFIHRADDIPAYAVYGFARVLWESINYCETDCAKDYPKQLETYKAYLTKSCYRDLENHFSSNMSLYSFRSRMLLPSENTVFNEKNISQVSNSLWHVKLEYNLKDDVEGLMTRDNLMMYPLKIIRSAKPLTQNTMGMEIDCYFGDGPIILEKKEVE